LSKDPRFDRHFDKLTSDYCRERLEWIDQQISFARSASPRLNYLHEQRQWWEKQLPFCQRREMIADMQLTQRNGKARKPKPDKAFRRRESLIQNQRSMRKRDGNTAF